MTDTLLLPSIQPAVLPYLCLTSPYPSITLHNVLSQALVYEVLWAIQLPGWHPTAGLYPTTGSHPTASSSYTLQPGTRQPVLSHTYTGRLHSYVYCPGLGQNAQNLLTNSSLFTTLRIGQSCELSSTLWCGGGFNLISWFQSHDTR